MEDIEIAYPLGASFTQTSVAETSTNLLVPAALFFSGTYVSTRLISQATGFSQLQVLGPAAVAVAATLYAGSHYLKPALTPVLEPGPSTDLRPSSPRNEPLPPNADRNTQAGGPSVQQSGFGLPRASDEEPTNTPPTNLTPPTEQYTGSSTKSCDSSDEETPDAAASAARAIESSADHPGAAPSKASIHDLPMEMVHQICSHMGTEHLLPARLVCRAWKACIDKGPGQTLYQAAQIHTCIQSGQSLFAQAPVWQIELDTTATPSQTPPPLLYRPQIPGMFVEEGGGYFVARKEPEPWADDDPYLFAGALPARFEINGTTHFLVSSNTRTDGFSVAIINGVTGSPLHGTTNTNGEANPWIFEGRAVALDVVASSQKMLYAAVAFCNQAHSTHLRIIALDRSINTASIAQERTVQHRANTICFHQLTGGQRVLLLGGTTSPENGKTWIASWHFEEGGDLRTYTSPRFGCATSITGIPGKDQLIAGDSFSAIRLCEIGATQLQRVAGTKTRYDVPLTHLQVLRGGKLLAREVTGALYQIEWDPTETWDPNNPQELEGRTFQSTGPRGYFLSFPNMDVLWLHGSKLLSLTAQPPVGKEDDEQFLDLFNWRRSDLTLEAITIPESGVWSSKPVEGLTSHTLPERRQEPSCGAAYWVKDRHQVTAIATVSMPRVHSTKEEDVPKPQEGSWVFHAHSLNRDAHSHGR